MLNDYVITMHVCLDSMYENELRKAVEQNPRLIFNRDCLPPINSFWDCRVDRLCDIQINRKRSVGGEK